MEKLRTLVKKRNSLKEEYSEKWVGICYFGKEGLAFVVYEDYPVKVFRRAGEVEKVRLKRIPLHVIYADSSLEEFSKAEKEEAKKAVKSYWGSVLYALKALGLIKIGCRIVEIDLETVAKIMSPEVFDNFQKLKNLFSDQFESPEDVELVKHYAVKVLDPVLEFYFSEDRCG